MEALFYENDIVSLLTLRNGYIPDKNILLELHGFCAKSAPVLNMLSIRLIFGGGCVKQDKRKQPKLKAFFSHEKTQQECKDTIADMEILKKFVKLALSKV